MFSKRKFTKNGKHKNVNFESYSIINSESLPQDECVPGFYLGSGASISNVASHPLPWHSNQHQEPSGYSQQEIDKIITPSDRFENLLSDTSDDRKPEIFVPIDSHHFDEEDYRNHRHRVYPHMHQPLKSMEPHVLRKIKEKIRDNKKAQLKAATAGVPTSVPQLLASSTDSRVLICSNAANPVISGPVLGLVGPEDTSDETVVVPIHMEQSVVIEPVVSLPPSVATETGPVMTMGIRKKRKRKRRRSKKLDPFQPTLGKLSEESSSPIHSANEVEQFGPDDGGVGAADDFENEFDEEGELEDAASPFDGGGLILEELCSTMAPDTPVHAISMQSGLLESPNKKGDSPNRTIPFLEEISFTEPPIGFLDLTLHHKNVRKHSLPMFIDVDHSEERVDIITSLSSTDLIRCPHTHPLPAPAVTPNDYSSPYCRTPVVADSLDPHSDDLIDDLRFTTSSASLVSMLASVTHPHPELNHSSLTQLASTSALAGESCLHLSPCSFQIGSFDNVAMSKPTVFSIDSMISPVEEHEQETPPLISSSTCSKQSSGLQAAPAPSTSSTYNNLSNHHQGYHHQGHHHHHHHHHHHKEHYNKRDLEKRTFSGQDMRSLWQCKDAAADDSIYDNQQLMLGDAIIDDMRNHRCYDMPAFNRTRFRNKYVHSVTEKLPIQRSKSETHSQITDPTSHSKDKIKKCTTCCDDNVQSTDYTKSQQDLICQGNPCQNECNCNDGLEDPLPLFVEMDILKPYQCWREVSRWVKFEQCYNELSDTFGRAHNSPLKFIAFTQFRVQMEDALFMPYVEAKSLSDAINQLVDQLLVAQLFTELRHANHVKEVLKLKHVHAGEKISYELDELTNLQTEMVQEPDSSTHASHNVELSDINLRVINTTPGNLNNVLSSNSFYSSSVKIKGNNENIGPKHVDPSFGLKYGQHSNFPSMIKLIKNSIPILRHPKSHKSDLEGHLPPNTEGVTVQVGELSELKKPFFAIMRFKTPLNMEKVTELNIPIRFMIVCLGPVGRVKYEELGRVISTMMINKDFRRMIYRATDKYEIIEGLYKYLDTCFVLSYSGLHPGRNIHSMVDHINDFSRIPCNISPLRSVSKENESIKHSASVNWADEKHSQLIKRADHHKKSESEFQAERQISHKSHDYESDCERLPPSYSKGDSYHLNIGDRVNEELLKSRKVPIVNIGVLRSVLFFLFRLLKLDLINYKERLLSDFVDAVRKDNVVIVLCGLLYLYFVCLSPALTFGALLGELVSEIFSVQLVLASQGTLLIFFALFGGNPLIVVGITGPMFLMESVIGQMASNFKMPILLYRFVVALYCTVIGIISLAFNITWIMQKVRRSVEECFNGFVGLYFIFKSILTIVQIFTKNKPGSLETSTAPITTEVAYDNVTSYSAQRTQYMYNNRVSVGLASLVMAYSMYQICIALNGVKRGKFFTRNIRKMVDYFNVAIGIIVLSVVNIIILNMVGIQLPTLMAEGNNTYWIRPPAFHEINSSMTFTAHTVAFILAFALLSMAFTETAIAGIIVTRQDRKVTKPSLFAQDQFICLCVFPMLSGIFGWPFISGAAVRSTSHIIAMTKWDHKVIPGVRHKILGVVEQRVTLLLAGSLVLATVSIDSLLNYIPKAAMLGMFLYMGVMGIRDLVVTRRLVTMFKRYKHWKDHEYMRNIPPSVLKAFEILQLAMITLMFAMNCVTEFTGIAWFSFLIPVLLLGYSLCRELVLPKIEWFTPHLDKLDPRHVIHIASICASHSHAHHRRSPSDKSQPALANRSVSVTSGAPTSIVLHYNADSQSDIDDSVDTSGNEMSSCTSSDEQET